MNFRSCDFENDVLAALERSGHVPLPPYITPHAQESDEARYQTVYALTTGAVAAPTAALHFDQALLDKLRDAKVSLGFLTFARRRRYIPTRPSQQPRRTSNAERLYIPEATVSAIKRAKQSRGELVPIVFIKLSVLLSGPISPSAIGDRTVYTLSAASLQLKGAD